MDELRELIERLRDYGNRDEPGICEQAADEIERLMEWLVQISVLSTTVGNAQRWASAALRGERAGSPHSAEESSNG